MTARPKIDSGIEAYKNDLDKPWQWEETNNNNLYQPLFSIVLGNNG